MGENEAEKPSNELFRSLPGAPRRCRALVLEEMVISRQLDATNDKGESGKKSSLPPEKRETVVSLVIQQNLVLHVKYAFGFPRQNP